MKFVSRRQLWTARAIAVASDALQLGLFPFVAAGFISPLDDALDLLVCIVLTSLVGWHFAFLPSFVFKVLPVADLAPTWTIAIFLATRQQRIAPEMAPTRVYADAPPLLQLNPPAASRR